MDDFVADGEGSKGLISEVSVVQYDGNNDDNNMYWFNITSNVHKTEIVTFLHS